MSEITRISILRNIPQEQLETVQRDFLDYGAATKVTRQPDGKYQIDATVTEIATPASGVMPPEPEHRR